MRTQPAGLVDDVGARLQIQVIGVGQDSLRAKFFHRFRQDSLDGGLGADCDERRSVDVAVLGPGLRPRVRAARAFPHRH